jgi:hypothetical protein
MAAQGVLALGIVLVVLLLILAGRTRTSPADDRQDARELIRAAIDAHIEALAARYLEARADERAGRPGLDLFSQEIELFIGDVLWRRAERAEPYLRDAVREMVVLERDAVYGEVRERVAAYLRRPSAARQPLSPMGRRRPGGR